MAGRLHPVDEWFGQKPCITYAGTEAIVIDDEWEHLLANNQHWTTEDVVRIAASFAPAKPKSKSFLQKRPPRAARKIQRGRDQRRVSCGFEGMRLDNPNRDFLLGLQWNP